MNRHIILLVSLHAWKKAFANKFIYVLISVICILLAYALFTGLAIYFPDWQKNYFVRTKANRSIKM